MQARLAASALGNASADQDPLSGLSDREKEIYRSIGKGVTSGTIADQSLLSSHMIDTHREHLKRELNLGTAAELSRLAFHAMIENT